MISIICRIDLFNLKTRKELKIHMIAEIELSKTENTKRPQK